MTLSIPVALLTALGPLLRGSWDVESQSLLELAVIAGFSLWLILRLFVGYIPLPSSRTLIWTAILFGLGILSFWRSPVHGLAAPNAYVMWTALWIFPAMASVSKDQRSWIDEAIRASGWILMALAFYQHFFLHDDRPASALVNQNAYAGTILMLLPLAVEKQDWLLVPGLLWSLTWTHSVGAWLGLSLALMLTQRRIHRTAFWVGAPVAILCAVALYGKLGTPEVLHRWWWWKAAWKMALDRPWTGYGPGAFAYVLPAYLPLKVAGLYSLYAHQYFLQTFADFGFPFALIWLAGLWHCLARNSSHKRFGVIAVLLNSLWDYTLSVPANLWLFSCFAASSIPHSPEGINVSSRYKIPCMAAVALLGCAWGSLVWARWSGQQSMGQAREAYQMGRMDDAWRWMARAEREIPDDPEVPRIAAAIQMQSAQKAPFPAAARCAWSTAAVYLKKSIRLNPYRFSSWSELALAYRRLGQADSAQRILLEAQRYQAQ